MITRCWWCDAEAVRLCDVLIGCERRKSSNTLIVGEPYTCDAAFCADHGRQIGHVCGNEPDSIDACCEHRGIGAVRLPDLATSKEASDKVRSAIRAKARRQLMRLVMP